MGNWTAQSIAVINLASLSKAKNSLKETVLEGGYATTPPSKARNIHLLCMEHPKRRMCPNIKNGTSEGEGSPQALLGPEIIPLKSPQKAGRDI